ncbi:hypothetical protein INT43_007847 [Umbelopsis isabellina]|uniref:Uncharacterized protein n=1 Tax=Mortierella isabellina TaxID=91625 RepID=A0A8H7PNU5_MORIS|nr:hypothetical protein INT43_007847 [Umbelopsis isabellina]
MSADAYDNLQTYLPTRFLTEIPHHWRIWRWKVSHAENSACQDFELCLAYSERLPDQLCHYRSCLLHQFIENQFRDTSTNTIGVEFGSRIVHIADKSIKLQIWDTAGQERFRYEKSATLSDIVAVTCANHTIAMSFLSSIDLSHEVTIEAQQELYWSTTSASDRDTFVGLTSWLRDVRTLASPELVVLLVGNKTDRAEDREVSYLEASRFAQEHAFDFTELMFMEASAMTGDGVEDIFLKCARSILTKVETGQIDPEKSGTGVQFGDSSLRRMTQRTRSTSRRKERSSCCF